MKRRLKLSASGMLGSLLLLLSPFSAMAESAMEPSVESAEMLTSIIITEIQTGNAARADEFIELYNATDDPVDITGWQLRYTTASATSGKHVEDPSAKIIVAPPTGEDGPLLLPAGGHYLLYSGTTTLPEGVLSQRYEGLLPATGGSLVLVGLYNETCQFVVEDAVAWGSTAHLFGEGEAMTPGSGSSTDRLYQRYVDVQGDYSDIDDNARDFSAINAAAVSAAPSPGTANSQSLPETPSSGSGATSLVLPERFSNPDCTPPPEEEPPVEPPITPPEESPPSVTEPPETDDARGGQPVIPASNSGLKAPLLSELLPNPAAPQTDKDDEFIELYNPNDQTLELSGYVLEVGVTIKRRYIIPDGVKIAPRAFLAFFAADTNIALSNSGSQVSLVDPLGTRLGSSEAYGTAKDGQAWVLANGAWQWTTKPTPNALNVVAAPAVKSSSIKKTAASVKTTASAGSSSAQKEGTELQQALPVVATTAAPLHPGVLALVAFSALLYGAYEYRHDMANKIYQFRTNRAARRAARQSVEGR